MRGTEKIIAHIQSDAKASADAILEEAKKQCAAIKKDYDQKADESYGKKIRAGVKACEDFAESKERIAQMESKKDILALKREIVEECFDKAKEQILKMSDKDYKDFITKLIVRASSTGDEQIILNEKDKKAIGADVVKLANAQIKNGKLTLSDETGDFSGGVVLKRGAVEVNSTLDLLINLCRNELSSQLAKVLFD